MIHIFTSRKMEHFEAACAELKWQKYGIFQQSKIFCFLRLIFSHFFCRRIEFGKDSQVFCLKDFSLVFRPQYKFSVCNAYTHIGMDQRIAFNFFFPSGRSEGKQRGSNSIGNWKQGSLNTRQVLLNEISLIHFVCSLSGNFIEKKRTKDKTRRRETERVRKRWCVF